MEIYLKCVDDDGGNILFSLHKHLCQEKGVKSYRKKLFVNKGFPFGIKLFALEELIRSCCALSSFTAVNIERVYISPEKKLCLFWYSNLGSQASEVNSPM